MQYQLVAKTYLEVPNYQSWTAGLYLIDAPCGSGKSYFVFKTLYPFVHEAGKKMLVFSNRLALKAQQELQAAGFDIQFMTYQKLEFKVYLDGWAEQGKISDSMQELEKFDYLVLDEAHYIFQDATFNKNTETIIKMIERFRTSKVIIMLSSTAELLREYFNDVIELPPTQSDYSYIKEVYFYNDRRTVNKIIDSISEDEKILMFGDKMERLEKLHLQYPDSVYLRSDNKDNVTFKQIEAEERFEQRILFSTKVLDNGINLKDKAIKHVIIEMSDVVDFIQCLGRKRVQDEDDTIVLYFLNNISSMAARYKTLKDDMSMLSDYNTMGNIERFRNKYLTRKKSELFNNCLEPILPVCYKAKHDFQHYQAIVKHDTSFPRLISERLGKKVKKYDSVDKNYELCSYLSKNIGRKYSKRDRKEIIEIFDIRKDGKQLKGIGSLNQYLKDYGINFEIIEIKERYVYWKIICRKWEYPLNKGVA